MAVYSRHRACLAALPTEDFQAAKALLRVVVAAIRQTTEQAAHRWILARILAAE